MGKEWMASIGKFETKTVRMIKYMEEDYFMEYEDKYVV